MYILLLLKPFLMFGLLVIALCIRWTFYKHVPNGLVKTAVVWCFRALNRTRYWFFDTVWMLLIMFLLFNGVLWLVGFDPAKDDYASNWQLFFIAIGYSISGFVICAYIRWAKAERRKTFGKLMGSIGSAHSRQEVLLKPGSSRR